LKYFSIYVIFAYMKKTEVERRGKGWGTERRDIDMV